MPLKILSDPHNLFSHDKFIITLDEAYDTLNQALNIQHYPQFLEPIDLSALHSQLFSLSSTLENFQFDSSFHGEFQATFTQAIHELHHYVEHIMVHIKNFEDSYNEIIDPYNHARKSLHEDLTKINHLLAHVQYKNSYDAILAGHRDHVEKPK